VGEEFDERAGGRFYGFAVGIDSVRLDVSRVPAIKWRYRDPTRRITLDLPRSNTGKPASQRTRQQRASICGEGARAPQDLARRPQPHLLHAPKPTDRPTVDFDRVGRVGVQVFEGMGVPPDADFYICGPAAFMSGLVDGLAGWGSPVTASTPRISRRARR
jgi:hypothetical protein